jgi:hypothetical protein
MSETAGFTARLINSSLLLGNIFVFAPVASVPKRWSKYRHHRHPTSLVNISLAFVMTILKTEIINIVTSIVTRWLTIKSIFR